MIQQYGKQNAEQIIEYSYENLLFTSNITGPNTSIFVLTKISNTEATVMINSSEDVNHEGNYSINIRLISRILQLLLVIL
jgi:hypothetical protein